MIAQQAHCAIKASVLAALLGGIASGVGYTLWYFALRGLSATQTPVVQRLVPIMAALDGIFLVIAGPYHLCLQNNYFHEPVRMSIALRLIK
ncbi:MAG: hypothetical protein K0A92_06080 [Methyloprofundus sp.]|nr:hypothetical protein [Methyloprofundus sp.]